MTFRLEVALEGIKRSDVPRSDEIALTDAPLPIPIVVPLRRIRLLFVPIAEMPLVVVFFSLDRGNLYLVEEDDDDEEEVVEKG